MRNSFFLISLLLAALASSCNRDLSHSYFEDIAVNHLVENVFVERTQLLRDSSFHEDLTGLEDFFMPVINSDVYYLQKESCGLSTADWPVHWGITDNEDSLDVIQEQFQYNARELKNNGFNSIVFQGFNNAEIIDFDLFRSINEKGSLYLRVRKHLEARDYALVDIVVQSSKLPPSDQVFTFKIYIDKKSAEVVGWDYSRDTIFEEIDCNM